MFERWLQLPPREKVESELRAQRIDAEKLARDPKAVDAAVAAVYRIIPIPGRWLISRDRVRQLVMDVGAKAPRR